MKKALCCAALLVSVNSFAAGEVSVANRVVDTGKDQVLSVGPSTTSQTTDLVGNEILECRFSMAVCKETMSYQVKVTKGSYWTSTEEEVPGTTKYSYSVQTVEKKSSEPVNQEDILQPIRVTGNCSQLREAYENQIVRTSDSKCAQ